MPGENIVLKDAISAALRKYEELRKYDNQKYRKKESAAPEIIQLQKLTADHPNFTLLDALMCFNRCKLYLGSSKEFGVLDVLLKEAEKTYGKEISNIFPYLLYAGLLTKETAEQNICALVTIDNLFIWILKDTFIRSMPDIQQHTLPQNRIYPILGDHAQSYFDAVIYVVNYYIKSGKEVSELRTIFSDENINAILFRICKFDFFKIEASRNSIIDVLAKLDKNQWGRMIEILRYLESTLLLTNESAENNVNALIELKEQLLLLRDVIRFSHESSNLLKGSNNTSAQQNFDAIVTAGRQGKLQILFDNLMSSYRPYPVNQSRITQASFDAVISSLNCSNQNMMLSTEIS